MPWPLGKTREQSVPFSMTVHSSATTSRVNHIFLGDRVSAKIEESARSEEHTSELQSHVRISYAVFCLKKKKNKKKNKKKKKKKMQSVSITNPQLQLSRAKLICLDDN